MARNLRVAASGAAVLGEVVPGPAPQNASIPRLLEKLKVESQPLRGRVFDILGEVFEETSLKDMLIKIIRFGDQRVVRSRLTRKIDQALHHEHLKSLLNRNSLFQEMMIFNRLYCVKEEIEKAEARRMQPYFIRSFFMKTSEQLDGSIYPREAGRFKITHVPTSTRERDSRITGGNRREQEPVLKRYDRICFEKETIQPFDKPGISREVLMHCGHRPDALPEQLAAGAARQMY